MWLCTYILMTSLVTLLIQTNFSKANVPFQQGEIVTCSGKCGVESNFPCSCHAKCFVRKNCCENITLDCPSILAESRFQYGSLLDADVICFAYDGYGIFMISSCPHGNIRGSVTSSSLLQANTLQEEALRVYPEISGASALEGGPHEETDIQRNERIARNKTIGLDMNTVVQLMKNAPVFDSSTRFSYLTSDVFFCHGGKASNRVNWKTQFYMENRDDVSDLQEITQRIKPSGMKYAPPFYIDTEKTEKCDHYAFGTESCDKDILQSNPTLEQLCDTFVSYVLMENNTRFRNRFCSYCRYGFDAQFRPVHKFIKELTWREITGLSVTFSLSQNNLLKLAITQIGTDVMWADPVCNPLWEFKEDPKKERENNMTCATIRCNWHFEVRPDGDCKTLHNTFIGFSGDDFSLTQQEEIKLSQFLGCGIDKYLGIEVIDFNPSVIKQHNEILNRTFYVTNASTFLTSFSSLSPSDPSLGTTLTKIRLLLQAFIEYRKPPSESVCKFDWVRTKSINKLKMVNTRAESSAINTDRNPSLKFLFLDTFSLLWSKNLSESSETIACLGSSPVISSHVKELYCVQEPIDKNDMSLILDICQSTCFSIFKPNRGVTGILVSQTEFFMSTLIAVVLLLN